MYLMYIIYNIWKTNIFQKLAKSLIELLLKICKCSIKLGKDFGIINKHKLTQQWNVTSHSSVWPQIRNKKYKMLVRYAEISS